jgi:hypothetical protein
MSLYDLAEEQRQVTILALVELKGRRPGWGEFLDDITDRILGGKAMRQELERLHGELGAAYSSTWMQRVEALEQAVHDTSLGVARLEVAFGLDRLDAYRLGGEGVRGTADLHPDGSDRDGAAGAGHPGAAGGAGDGEPARDALGDRPGAAGCRGECGQQFVTGV